MAESKQKSWISDIADKINIKKKSAEDSTAPSSAEAGNLHDHDADKQKIPKGTRISYIILSIVTAILAIVVLIVSIHLVLFITYASFGQKVRTTGGIILAVSALLTLIVMIVGSVGIRKNTRNALILAGTLLIIIAAVQAVVVGVTIAMKERDKESISEAMALAFPSNIPLGASRWKWNFVQFEGNCCGVLGPEDYRDHKLENMKPGYPPPILPPNVPIACCKSFDFDRPEEDQESNRQRCRFQRAYYTNGCQHNVILTAHGVSLLVAAVTIVLMVLELLTAIPLLTAAHKPKPKNPDPKPEEPKKEERKGSVVGYSK